MHPIANSSKTPNLLVSNWAPSLSPYTLLPFMGYAARKALPQSAFFERRAPLGNGIKAYLTNLNSYLITPLTSLIDWSTRNVQSVALSTFGLSMAQDRGIQCEMFEAAYPLMNEFTWIPLVGWGARKIVMKFGTFTEVPREFFEPLVISGEAVFQGVNAAYPNLARFILNPTGRALNLGTRNIQRALAGVVGVEALVKLSQSYMRKFFTSNCQEHSIFLKEQPKKLQKLRVKPLLSELKKAISNFTRLKIAEEKENEEFLLEIQTLHEALSSRNILGMTTLPAALGELLVWMDTKGIETHGLNGLDLNQKEDRNVLFHLLLKLKQKHLEDDFITPAIKSIFDDIQDEKESEEGLIGSTVTGLSKLIGAYQPLPKLTAQEVQTELKSLFKYYYLQSAFDAQDGQVEKHLPGLLSWLNEGDLDTQEILFEKFTSEIKHQGLIDLAFQYDKKFNELTQNKAMLPILERMNTKGIKRLDLSEPPSSKELGLFLFQLEKQYTDSPTHKLLDLWLQVLKIRS